MDKKFKCLRNTRTGMVIHWDPNLADLPHMEPTNDAAFVEPAAKPTVFRQEEKPAAPVAAPAVAVEPAVAPPAAPVVAEVPVVAPVAAPANEPEVHLPRRRK
jgi:hypothetical protein